MGWCEMCTWVAPMELEGVGVDYLLPTGRSDGAVDVVFGVAEAKCFLNFVPSDESTGN